MKNMFSEFAKSKAKKIIVSAVALTLSLCMLTSVTYSWIDKISEISVVTPKPDGKSTLTIDSTTDSVINLQADNTETVIDIGSYFNLGGDMHLTSCSGNGKDFFFKSDVDSSNSYFRRGTANDVNVNYISCTFKVTSTFDNTVLWLNELPELMMGETDLSNYLRCAITVDDETTVFSNGGSYKYVNSNTISNSDNTGYALCNAVKPVDYLYESCKNYLFFIDKGDTKTVNVKLWIEDPTSALSINSQDLSVKLSLLTTLNRQTITFRDCTFSTDGINQVSSGSFYACLGTLDDYNLDTYWSFTQAGDYKYNVDIPIIYRNEKILIMNCDDSYGTGDNQLNDETIYYNYIWEVDLTGTAKSTTYNAFGPLGTVTKSQNGFWGEAKKVFVDDLMGLEVSSTTMLLNETEKSTSYSMYYNVNKGKWAGYIHSTSTKIQFNVKGTGDYWGYHSDTGNQTKPSTSDVYTIYDINNGTWTENSTLGMFAVAGDFNDWNGTPMLLSDSSANTYYAAVDLEPGEHEFKIINNTDKTWLGSTSASFSFGSDETTMSASATLSTDTDNVPLNITSLYGGTVLFVIDKDNNKVTLKYTPSTTSSNEVRSYVMVNTSYGTDWLTKINHWTADTYFREVAKVSNFNLNNNMYMITDGSWDSGSWSYYNDGDATGNTLYLKPNSNWLIDDARFAAYFFNSSGNTWKSMTDTDGDGYYECEKPSGYTTVIFCRMNPSTTANNWTNKWNQTGDLSLTVDSTAYTLYYTNMETQATNLQFVSGTTYVPSSTGFNMGTPVNGAMYILTSDNVQCTNKLNIQKVTSVTVSGTKSVGNTLTFSSGATPTTGTAYKGYNYSYYVTNTDTGTSWTTDSKWTPLYAGNYQVTLRVNDGYITTAESTAVKFTVS